MWWLKPTLNLRRMQMEISVWTWLFVSEAVVDEQERVNVQSFWFNSKVHDLDSKTVKQLLSRYKLQSTDLNKAEVRS